MKKKLGSQSTIHSLDENEMSRRREVWPVFVFCLLNKPHSELYLDACIREVGSTSPPGGNQVDGLPPASSWMPNKC